VNIGNALDPLRPGASPAGTIATDGGKAKASTASAVAPQPASSSKVELSGGMAALKSGLSLEDAFDSKRVEHFRAAIANGSFKVDAHVVADKVISGNLEALARSAPK